jgi:alpha-L-fucosidase 2
MKLWYKQPARHWLEALPVGNGSQGAMVFGGTHTERISLNEETLWSGYPRDTDNPAASSYLSEARKLVFAGKYGQAQKLINEKMLSHTNTESYMPLGDLTLAYNEFPSEFSGYSDYQRSLDLERAAAVTEFTSSSGVKIKREIISSFPTGCLFIHITSSDPLGLTASFSSPLKHNVNCENDDLLLTGQAPSHVEPSYRPDRDGVFYEKDNPGMAFESRLRVLGHNGKGLEKAGGSLTIYGATEILLAVACSTSFGGYNVMPGESVIDPAAVNRELLNGTMKKDWSEHVSDHLKDYQTLFNRVSLDLGINERSLLPTDERLAVLENPAEDPQLVSLLYQYGRYLLIASSRTGGQPVNLQGIWNKEVRAPWSSNMTMNINAQMNYWLAESTALSECHEPFFAMLKELAKQGRETAKKHFACRGTLSAHNADLWRFTSPVRGHAQHAQWPFGLAWSCAHIWEHYCFTGDRVFLADMIPVMKGSARFFLDYLVDDPETGLLITCPSTSPENRFYDPSTGESVSVGKGTTMDMAIIEELFDNLLQAMELLNDTESDSLAGEIKEALTRLFRPGIGSQGQLLEFHGDFKEPEPQHRHVSHLYGVYPGSLYTDSREPEYFRAAEKSLEIRGDLSTGWAMAWRIALWARFKKGDRALGVVKNFLHLISPNEKTKGADYSTGGGIYPNMFCAHPPFQIDGNFGAVAGITEMFVQSHHRLEEKGDTHAGTLQGSPRFRIDLLPALPSTFPDGEIRGIKARGNVTVSVKWTGGELERVELISQPGGELTVTYGSFSKVLTAEKEKTMILNSKLEIV